MAVAVVPKTDCPHISDHFDKDACPESINVVQPCKGCEDTSENWICLKCYEVNCSRFIKGHGLKHTESTGHQIAASFSDLSIWCYSCDSYIKNPVFNDLLQKIRASKFGKEETSSHPSQQSSEEEESSDEEDQTITIDLLRKMMGMNFQKEEEEKYETVLGNDLTLESIAKSISEGKCKKIIVMSGAGVSTASGIPDFRSPGTGLYHNLQKYNLPHPTAVFELDYFKKKPEPFYMLAKELFPGNFKPSPAHYFIKLLEQKNVLLRNYTQNIDTLEREAKVSPEYLMEAHGSFGTASCVACKTNEDVNVVKECIFSATVPKCKKCGELVKPDIVFFGESLPTHFFQWMAKDFPECDLLIVIGTSLQVQPFASLIHKVPPTTPRLLINNEVVGQVDPQLAIFGLGKQGFRFGMDNNYRDVSLIGDCQEGVKKLVELIGWKEDFEILLKQREEKKKEEEEEEKK